MMIKGNEPPYPRKRYLIYILVLGSVALAGLAAYINVRRRQYPNKAEHVGSHKGRVLQEAGHIKDSKEGGRPTVQIWRNLAEDAGIFQNRIERVSELLKIILERSGTNIDPADIPRFRESLRRFIAMHKFALNSEEYAVGVSNWLTYCIIEALKRHMQKQTSREVLKHYRAVCDKLTKHIRKQIWKKIPEPERPKFRNLVKSGLKQFHTELRRRIKLLHNDFLCPAFKKPMDEQDVKRLIADYSIRSLYPDLEEPLLPMITKEERFTQRLENFFNDNVSVALFTMFYDPNHEEWEYTDYLGYMKSGGWNTDRFWPAFVQLTPNELKNELKGWERKNHDD